MANRHWPVLLLLIFSLGAGPLLIYSSGQTMTAMHVIPFGASPLTDRAVARSAPFVNSSRASWDEQLGETFTQDFTSLAINVTAVEQSGGTGIGPGYLLNGLSNSGYWYQVGLSWNWNPGSGFDMLYDVFDPNGNSIYPANGGGGLNSLSGPVNAGDTVLLNLYFDNSTGNVVMYIYDYNTGASASETYSTEGATNFQGSNSASNGNGFFTGLMTEWYHTNPYYGGEQQVTYWERGFQFTSATLWMDEYNVNTGQVLFSDSTSGPISLTGQLYPYSSSGAVEYASSSTFVTGPIAFELTSFSSSPMTADLGMQAIVSFSSAISGGIPPYNYYLYADGVEVANVSTSTQNFQHTFYLNNLAVGQHTFYVIITDSDGGSFTSSTYGITVNPDPIILISVPRNTFDIGQTLTVSSSTSQGTPPFTIAYYLNGNLMNGGTTILSSAGTYQVSAQLTDSLGYQADSNALSITVNPDPFIDGTYSTGSNNFFYSNDAVTVNATTGGGTSPFTYIWYLNGQEVASTSSSSYAYQLTSMGQNTLKVIVTDAVGYTTQATLSVNFTYNYTNIVIIVAIIIVVAAIGVAIAVKRRGRTNGVQPAQNGPVSSPPPSAPAPPAN